MRAGRLHYAVEDPDEPVNWPRLLFVWRANLLGSSGKGHEYFLRHLIGSDVNNVLADEAPPERRPKEVVWRDQAPLGKLDLLVTLDFRMTSTGAFADVILPAATWYEKSDLSCTDLHPYVHSFNPAVDPPWEARSDWEAFRELARVFSGLAAKHLGVRHDLVATALAKDTPQEMAQPGGRVRDWRAGRGCPRAGQNDGQSLPRDPRLRRPLRAVREPRSARRGGRRGSQGRDLEARPRGGLAARRQRPLRGRRAQRAAVALPAGTRRRGHPCSVGRNQRSGRTGRLGGAGEASRTIPDRGKRRRGRLPHPLV